MRIAHVLHVSTDYLIGCTEYQMRLKKKGFDESNEKLWLMYQVLSDDAKARIRNQILFEYSQQENRKE